LGFCSHPYLTPSPFSCQPFCSLHLSPEPNQHQLPSPCGVKLVGQHPRLIQQIYEKERGIQQWVK
jgi:hypothetical protein